MWTRYELKSRAKDMLRRNYWYAFAASLIPILISGGLGGIINFYFQFSLPDFFTPDKLFDTQEYARILRNFIFFYWPYFAVGIIIVLMLSIAYNLFVALQLEVGKSKFFIKAVYEEIDLENLIFTYKSGSFLNVALAMFMKNLILFLIALCGGLVIGFIMMIPFVGIVAFVLIPVLIVVVTVKAVSYMFVPYILADNPNINWRRALKLSEDMAYGHKLDIVILHLSFIGWFLLAAMLGVLTCGIGSFSVVFLYPYLDSTFAELYIKLKQLAYERNLVQEGDFN